MTAQWYASYLAPGMIADYGLEGSFGMDPALWKWIDAHFTGPFAYSGSSTAHWTQHFYVSNKADEDLLRAADPIAKLYTEGFSSQGVIPQKSLSVAEYVGERHFNLEVYFGKNSLPNLAEFLAKYPIPMTPVSTVLNNLSINSERDRYLKQRNLYWEKLVTLADFPYHVHLRGEVTAEIEKWIDTDIDGTVHVISKTDNIGMFHFRSDCQTIVAFADKAKAAKFKLFWHDR